MTMRILSTLAILTIAALSLAACNTVDGVGRDVEKVGNSIQNN